MITQISTEQLFTSKLRSRIKYLKDNERNKLLNTSLSLFMRFLEDKSDEFTLSDEHNELQEFNV